MHPHLAIPWLGVTLHAEATFVQLAVLATMAFATYRAGASEGLDRGRVGLVMAVLALVALVGGRLHFIVNHPGVYVGRWHEALRLWGGPFHLPGGLLAVVAATPLVCRRAGVPVGRFADALAPAVGVGIALARAGCLLQSCCFGALCRRAWCMTFPPGSMPYEMHRRMEGLPEGAAASLPVHPLQLYFLVAGLLIMAVSLGLARRKRYDGQVALVAMVLFAATSAAIEPFRADYFPRSYWGPLPQLLWTGLAMTAAATAALVLAERAHRHAARTAEPPQAA